MTRDSVPKQSSISRAAPQQVDGQSVPDPVQARLERLDRLAHLMDRAIRLPGGFRIGLDGLIGLIPGIGDLSTFAVAAYIINEGRQLGVRKRTLTRMSWNVGTDTLIGAIPLFGDLFDFYLKANIKNINLIRKDVERQRQQAGMTERDST